MKVTDKKITLILADNQPITRLGIITLWSRLVPEGQVLPVKDRMELLKTLMIYPEALIIVDYTLFDFSGFESLLITAMRFDRSRWIIFCDDLNGSFLRRIVPERTFGVVMKDDSIEEIALTLQNGIAKRQYLSVHAKMILQNRKGFQDNPPLTPTEVEVLKSIAQGKSSQAVADERNLSVHTIATHRKNIFRKIGVNNAVEAAKYAVQIGIVNVTEYYI
ncbi:MAG: response regulator transcription factor [Tannerella sp.]|nr:response regulator transcription factor [Tannerella sp.]